MRIFRLAGFVVALTSGVVASAIGGQTRLHEVWVCGAPIFPQKYIVEGNLLTKPFRAGGTNIVSSFNVLQNNTYSIIAVSYESKTYPPKDGTERKVVSVFASVIMIRKIGDERGQLHEWSYGFPTEAGKSPEMEKDDTSNQGCTMVD